MGAKVLVDYRMHLASEDHNVGDVEQSLCTSRQSFGCHYLHSSVAARPAHSADSHPYMAHCSIMESVPVSKMAQAMGLARCSAPSPSVSSQALTVSIMISDACKG